MIDPKVQRQLYFAQIANPSEASVTKYRGKATPAVPGSGPDGETCRTCANRKRVHIRSGRVFQKCGMVKWTHGKGTDVKLSWPACSFWKPMEDDDDDDDGKE